MGVVIRVHTIAKWLSFWNWSLTEVNSHLCLSKDTHKPVGWTLGAHREVLKSWISVPYPQMPRSPKVYGKTLRPIIFYFFVVVPMKDTNRIMVGPHPHGHTYSLFTLSGLLLYSHGWHSRNTQNKINYYKNVSSLRRSKSLPFPTKETQWFNNSVLLQIITFEI